MLPWLRRAPQAGPSGWPVFSPMDFVLRDAAEEVLAVERSEMIGATLALGGSLRVTPSEALERLRGRLGPHGYTPFLRQERGLTWVRALPLPAAGTPSHPLVHLGLFLATVATTLLAGTMILGGVSPAELWARPGRIVVGVPFAASLLLVLGIHELGHYVLGRRHGMPVSLPYFIPVPPVPPFLLGTLGAVIKLRGIARDRRALFDMAVAGPLAGLAVALPLYALGLRLSTVVQMPGVGEGGGGYVQFGDALLPKLMEWLVLGSLRPGEDILLHPVGVAAWFGFFVTALNLIPAGQLDGGHIAYALFGQRHGLVSRLAVAGLVTIAVLFRSVNWLVWALLIVAVMGIRHGPTMDDITPLGRGRQALAILALLLLVLLLPPVPLSVR